MFNPFGLKFRIFGGFFLVILLLQYATIYEIFKTAVGDAYDNTRQELKDGKALFLKDIHNRNRFLNSTLESLSKNTELQYAAANNHKKSIRNLLANQAQRIGADLAFFVSNKNATVVTDETVDLDETIIDGLRHVGDTPLARVVKINERYYQLNIAVINVPRHIGWVAMGFAIDEQLAAYYSRLTKTEISFVEKADTGFQYVASTVNEERLQINRLWLSDMILTKGVYHVQNETSESLTLTTPLPNTIGWPIYIVIERSITDQVPAFVAWWQRLYRLLIFNFLFAVIAAVIVTRSISRPVSRLVQAAEKISSGDYQTNIDVNGRNEIAVLAQKFSQMQDAVAEREVEIRNRASRDAMTGLWNRDGFSEQVSQHIQMADRDGSYVVVAVLDLHRFKEVNDTLGYKLGDDLLMQIAERLSMTFVDQAQLGHLGVDDFAVVKNVTNYGDVNLLVDKILACFDQVFDVDGIRMSVSCSLGVALYPDQARDMVTLLRLANIALSYASDNRLQSAIYDRALDSHSVQRLTLMNELQHAIAENQLVLYYQPKLSLDPNASVQQVENVECLVRWAHPVHGFINPDQFIPLAEQTGHVVELTQWVLDKALAQTREWLDSGISIRVAVNISAVDLLHQNFSKRVAELLQKYSLSSDALALEVTESAVMEDPDNALRILHELKAMGVLLSIDDYGTGYSSLAQLKKLPVDELKIDKNFVLDMHKDEDDVIIVQSTIELGHSMGLKVVAEGVESSSVLKQLISYGCDVAQGMGISKPLTAEEFSQWIQQTHYQIHKA